MQNIHTVHGGPDHPRNYAVMHASLNRSFGDKLPDYKLAYVEEHAPAALHHVKRFVTEMRRSPAGVESDRNYVKTTMTSWAPMCAE